MNSLFNPWPWYVSGPLIALTMALLIFMGRRFGMSSNLRTLCSIAGAGKRAEFFRINLKEHSWNLIVMLGAILGGFLAANFLTENEAVAISQASVEKLNEIGISDGGQAYLPQSIYAFDSLFEIKTFLILSIGGLLIGFGTRYAGGCTSGHAISGLSNLQFPSLIAVLGFFAGGLFMIHCLFPLIF
ncbi:MAG: YeeE/YedE thiosulfate transporter family protein [Bacteroidota bacterium]